MSEVKNTHPLDRCKQLLTSAYHAVIRAVTHQDDSSAEPTSTVVDTTRPSFPLTQATATLLDIDLHRASRHPFLNFINGCLKRGEDKPKVTEKVLTNFTDFLSGSPDPETAQAFFAYFASKQGLFLYRCRLKNIRYFSKTLIKLTDNHQAVQNIFTALSNEQLLATPGDRDHLLIQLLTDETIKNASDASEIHAQVASTIQDQD